jgi:hypothetical protein
LLNIIIKIFILLALDVCSIESSEVKLAAKTPNANG